MYRKVEKATLQIDDNGTDEQRGKNGRSIIKKNPWVVEKYE